MRQNAEHISLADGNTILTIKPRMKPFRKSETGVYGKSDGIPGSCRIPRRVSLGPVGSSGSSSTKHAILARTLCGLLTGRRVGVAENDATSRPHQGSEQG